MGRHTAVIANAIRSNVKTTQCLPLPPPQPDSDDAEGADAQDTPSQSATSTTQSTGHGMNRGSHHP